VELLLSLDEKRSDLTPIHFGVKLSQVVALRSLPLLLPFAYVLVYGKVCLVQ